VGKSLGKEEKVNPGNVYVGIDVAKERLDVAPRPVGDGWHVANDERGIAELVTRLEQLKPALVVLEATGGMELPLVGALTAAGLAAGCVVREGAVATQRMAAARRLDRDDIGAVVGEELGAVGAGDAVGKIEDAQGGQGGGRRFGHGGLHRKRGRREKEVGRGKKVTLPPSCFPLPRYSSGPGRRPRGCRRR